MKAKKIKKSTSVNDIRRNNSNNSIISIKRNNSNNNDIHEILCEPAVPEIGNNIRYCTSFIPMESLDILKFTSLLEHPLFLISRSGQVYDMIEGRFLFIDNGWVHIDSNRYNVQDLVRRYFVS